MILDYMQLEPQTKRKIRELLNASISKICHKYREPTGDFSKKTLIDLQNQAQEVYERIMRCTDTFLDDEKIALRSEEFITLLFDDFYSHLRELGIISAPSQQDPSEQLF